MHSDEWAAYSQISSAGYSHSSVNHSLHFVDPITDTHTQHIESYWSRAKAKLKRMHGTCDDHLPEYLDEFMWREKFGRTVKEAHDNGICHISERYPLLVILTLTQLISCTLYSTMLICVSYHHCNSCTF